jgi:hypothetical protein
LVIFVNMYCVNSKIRKLIALCLCKILQISYMCSYSDLTSELYSDRFWSSKALKRTKISIFWDTTLCILINGYICQRNPLLLWVACVTKSTHSTEMGKLLQVPVLWTTIRDQYSLQFCIGMLRLWFCSASPYIFITYWYAWVLLSWRWRQQLPPDHQ